MNPDGNNQTRLTIGSAHNFEPVWSPAGSRIAFTRFEEFVFNYEVYVMKADGSNQTRLTTNFTDDHHPAWSPDGAKLVFTSTRNGNRQLYSMNSDGTNQTRLANTPADDFDPNWQAAFTINGRITNGAGGLAGINVNLSG